MVTVTNDYFFINGVRCDTVGLSCDTPPVPPMAAQNYTQWNTGRDTPIASPDNTFEPVAYTLTCRVFLDDDAYDNSAIYKFLENARTLAISRLTGYYFKIMTVNGITPTVKYDGKVIGYKISFTLAPFRYFLDNMPVEITTGTITNPGNRYSRPKYVITDIPSGTTSITLNVNGQQFVISNLTSASTTITIDAEKLMCYDQRTAQYGNLMPNSTGQIPFLATGVNTAYTSAGTLTITGNWRSY